MLPLRVAFLWHKHQPYYKIEDEFLLPWTRLHGVKDYFDLPELLHEFPEIRQTINLVPSLMMQIEEYASGKTIDKVQRLTKIPVEQLDEEQKNDILKLFFVCNVDKMINPYQRYKQLYDKAQNAEIAINEYTNQDWLDLQVWYNLTWIGQLSRQKSSIRRLFKKGRDFNENEKEMLMEFHKEILRSIRPHHNYLRKLGQVEFSVSPMQHPILPLLCNSRSAHEAMPGIPMPEPLYKWPEDARSQVGNAISYYEERFGARPDGMWPSEGSVSDEALAILAETGLKWAASDEGVLAGSVNDFKPTEKFFPRRVKTANGNIAMLFRDHFLSDRIGFVYSKWKEFDAANDFLHHLFNIRNEIIRVHGEESLNHAVVPVILDGENCWEYYNQNGLPFLREFYSQLTNAHDIKTVTCSEATAAEHLDFLPPLDHIKAGSWINANFSIWIGHEDDRKAWSMLAKARRALEDAKDNIPKENYNEALQEISIAEGSDWFWWYCDEHEAENKSDFDVLFRWHIRRVYELIGKEAPEDVKTPISEQKALVTLMEQHGEVHPVIDGISHPEPEWENAGYYDAKSSISTMHQVGELLRRLWFASDEYNIYLRFDTIRKIRDNEKIMLTFHSPEKLALTMMKNGIHIESDDTVALNNFSYASQDVIEISFSRKMLFKVGGNEENIAEITIRTFSKDGEMEYPREGKLSLEFV